MKPVNVKHLVVSVNSDAAVEGESIVLACVATAATAASEEATVVFDTAALSCARADSALLSANPRSYK